MVKSRRAEALDEWTEIQVTVPELADDTFDSLTPLGVFIGHFCYQAQ